MDIDDVIHDLKFHPNATFRDLHTGKVLRRSGNDVIGELDFKGDYIQVENKQVVPIKRAMEMYKSGKTIFCRVGSYTYRYNPYNSEEFEFGTTSLYAKPQINPVPTDQDHNPIGYENIVNGTWYYKEEI